MIYIVLVQTMPPAQILADPHGAEIGAAHGAEAGAVRAGSFPVVEILHGPVGIQGQVELVLPTELVTGLAHRVVADFRARMLLGDVGRVGGYLVGNDAHPHVFLLRQAEVFLRGHIAQHGRAVPADHGRADG